MANKQTKRLHKLGISTKNTGATFGGSTEFPKGKQPSKRTSKWLGAGRNL